MVTKGTAAKGMGTKGMSTKATVTKATVTKGWYQCGVRGTEHLVVRGLQTQCGVNFFISDLRRDLAPAPKLLGSDIKTHLESRLCLAAILKNKKGVMLEFEIGGRCSIKGY